MLKKIIKSLKYRLNKVNYKTIKGNDNEIENKGIFQGVEIDIKGSGNRIEIAKRAVIRNCYIRIYGDNNLIKIGEGCSVMAGELWLEGEDCQLILGNKTTIEEAHLAVTELNSVLEIGKDCMLAKKIEIRTGDSHSILDGNMERVNDARSVKIGNHVWIGNRAIILKGVQIEDNTIVGTGSVVTKSYGSNLIIGGNPARIIKENMNWDRERIIK